MAYWNDIELADEDPGDRGDRERDNDKNEQAMEKISKTLLTSTKGLKVGQMVTRDHNLVSQRAWTVKDANVIYTVLHDKYGNEIAVTDANIESYNLSAPTSWGLGA